MVARLLWVSESKRSMSVLTKGSARSKELKERLTATRNDYATAQGVQSNYTENLREKIKQSGCSADGSALALGARCRRFESCHSDQELSHTIAVWLGLFLCSHSDAVSVARHSFFVLSPNMGIFCTQPL